MKNHKIKLLSLNINGGIRDKIEFIKMTFHTYQLDALLIQEAKLCTNDIPNISKLLKPFATYFALGPTKKHGNIIILKAQYKKYVINHQPSLIAPSDAQYITLPLGFTICCIANIYLPAHHTVEHENLANNILEETARYMTKTRNAARIITGDYNINLSNNSQRSTYIRSIASSLDLQINLPNSPTHKLGNTLDYAMVSKSIQHKLTVITDGLLHSDHFPILLDLNIRDPPYTTTITRYSGITEQSLRLFANNIEASASQTHNILELYKLICKTAKENFKELSLSLHANNIFNSPDITRQRCRLKLLNRHLKYLQNPNAQWTQNFTLSFPTTAEAIKVEITQIRSNLRFLIQQRIKEKRAAFNKLKNTDIKHAYKRAIRKPESTSIFAVKTANGSLSYDPATVLQNISSYASRKQNIPSHLQNNNALIPISEEFSNILIQNNTPIDTNYIHSKVSLVDLKKLLSKLKKKSAAGIDGITISMIRSLNDNTLRILCKHISSVLNGEYNHNLAILKIGYVSLIPKKANYSTEELSNPASFRPITVLPILYKIISAIINYRLSKILLNNNIISPTQRGFKKGARPIDISRTIKNLCNTAFSSKKDLYITMIDYSDAYGSVIHQRLAELLKLLGFPCKTVHLLSNILGQHSIHLKTYYGLTPAVNISRGLPQGDPLAPTLFNLYTEIISRILNETKLGFQSHSATITNLTYADDTTLIDTSHSNAQEKLTILAKLCKELGLEINTMKTKIAGISFTPSSQSPTSVKPLILDSKPLTVIPFDSPFKIVGYTLCSIPNSKFTSADFKEKANSAIDNLFLISMKPKYTITIMNSIVMGKLRYFGALNDISQSDLEKVTKRMRVTLSRNLYASPSLPHNFYHADRNLHGCQMPTCHTIHKCTVASNLIYSLNSDILHCSRLLKEELQNNIKKWKRYQTRSKCTTPRDPNTRLIHELNKLGLFIMQGNDDSINCIKPKISTQDNWNINPIPASVLPNLKHAWTDASFDKNKLSGGGGIIWTNTSGQILHTHSFHIPKTNSSTHAELLTIAVTSILSPNNMELTIFCDNKIATKLKAYHSWSSNRDIATFILDSAKHKNIKLSLKWIKGHSGLPLNEAADKAAKEGHSSNMRADIYQSIRIHMKKYCWTDGITCDPDLNTYITMQEIQTIEHTREGYDTANTQSIHSSSYNHWNSPSFNPLHSNMLIKFRLDGLNNRDMDRKIKKCACKHNPASIRHILTDCQLTARIRNEFRQECQQILDDYQISIPLSFYWDDIQTTPQISPNVLSIGWRGIITKQTFHNLTQYIPCHHLEIDNKKERSKCTNEIINSILLKLGQLMYDTYKLCCPVTTPRYSSTLITPPSMFPPRRPPSPIPPPAFTPEQIQLHLIAISSNTNNTN